MQTPKQRVLCRPPGILSRKLSGSFQAIVSKYLQIIEVLKSQPIQPMDSVLCGLYCIYIAHILFDSKYSSLIFMNDNDLMRFSKHML